MTIETTADQTAPTGRSVYEQNRWAGCPGAAWDNLPQAAREGDDKTLAIFAEALSKVPADIADERGPKHYWVEGYCQGREATS